MGIFSRSRPRNANPLIPHAELAQLPHVGRARFAEGQRPDVSGFYLPGLLTAGSPSPGSTNWDAFVDAFLRELSDATAGMGDWALPGALYVAAGFIGAAGLSNPHFAAVVDNALPFMAAAGVSSAFIPMFLQERWHEFH